MGTIVWLAIIYYLERNKCMSGWILEERRDFDTFVMKTKK